MFAYFILLALWLWLKSLLYLYLSTCSAEVEAPVCWREMDSVSTSQLLHNWRNSHCVQPPTVE